MLPIDAMCSIVSPTENPYAASNHDTAIVARWDDDGGAPRNFSPDAEAARDERRRPARHQPDSRPGEIDEIPPTA